ncbi:MAG: hypothetical protein AB1405_10625, partial [Bdellovibrionota bacterium]
MKAGTFVFPLSAHPQRASGDIANAVPRRAPLNDFYNYLKLFDFLETRELEHLLKNRKFLPINALYGYISDQL